MSLGFREDWYSSGSDIDLCFSGLQSLWESEKGLVLRGMVLEWLWALRVLVLVSGLRDLVY